MQETEGIYCTSQYSVYFWGKTIDFLKRNMISMGLTATICMFCLVKYVRANSEILFNQNCKLNLGSPISILRSHQILPCDRELEIRALYGTGLELWNTILAIIRIQNWSCACQYICNSEAVIVHVSYAAAWSFSLALRC